MLMLTTEFCFFIYFFIPIKLKTSDFACCTLQGKSDQVDTVDWIWIHFTANDSHDLLYVKMCYCMEPLQLAAQYTGLL